MLTSVGFGWKTPDNQRHDHHVDELDEASLEWILKLIDGESPEGVAAEILNP